MSAQEILEDSQKTQEALYTLYTNDRTAENLRKVIEATERLLGDLKITQVLHI